MPTPRCSFWLSAVLLLFCPATHAQTHFTFSQIGSPVAGQTIAAQGDFNNDGYEDLITIDYADPYSDPTSPVTDSSQIYLTNGNGTWATPVNLPQPAYGAVVGDFNRDGKLDYAIAGSTGLLVYLGNGDGTFQAAKAIAGSRSSTLLVAADVNHDSKTDLIQIPSSAGTTIQTWISNGDGSFSKGQQITSGVQASVQMLTGDFDGDGKPDLALANNQQGTQSSATAVQIWYGDGAGHFASPYQFFDPRGYMDGTLTVADVNGDGKSDLIGTPVPLAPRISIFFGNANRTLSDSIVAIDQCPVGGSVAVADFTGDGVNDIAFSESGCSGSGSTTDFVLLPGTGKGGFASPQTIYESTDPLSAPSVIKADAVRPSIALVNQTSDSSNLSTYPPTALELLTNDTPYGFPSCDISVAEGISVCQPQPTESSPVVFSLATAGPTPMRTAAVWIDGKKVAEQLTHAFSHYSFLDVSIPVAYGIHKVTIFGTGWDNTLQQQTFSLNVNSYGGCGAPSSPGVEICTPAEGTTVTSPVQIQATGMVSGTFARIEVWIDGAKKYTQTTNPVVITSIPVAPGTHRFGVIVVNTAGAQWRADNNATVK